MSTTRSNKETVEQDCISLWMGFFPGQTFDTEKNFVELGGSSLNMVMLLWKVNEQFEIDIDMVDFITNPTLATLVRLTEEALSPPSEQDEGQATEIAVARNGSLPLSSPQKRLWLIDQIEGPSAKYNVALAFEIDGIVDEAVVEKALKAVLIRHEVLRTYVIEQDGEPMLVLRDEFDVPFQLIDLSHLDPQQSVHQAAQSLSEEAHYLFDLGKDILVRLTLIRIEKDRHTLLINLHHLVCDGWSLSLFTTELSEWIGQYSANNNMVPVQPIDTQYFDYSQWQQSWIGSDEYQQQIDYWKKQLTALQSDNGIPLDYQRPAILSHAGAMFRYNLNVADVAGLKLLARNCGVTSFVALQAVFALLIARWSNQSDIAIGAPFSNRKHREYEKLIGFFANTLVIRNDVRGDINVREYLRACGETCKQALTNQDVPFDKVVEALNPERQVNLNPFFQCFFALQDNDVWSLSLPNAVATEIVVPNKTAKFDLSLHIFEGGDDVVAHWEYNTDVLSEATVNTFSQQFNYLLKNMVATPEKSLDELPTIYPAQQPNVILANQSLDQTTAIQPTIHDIFTAYATASPDDIALRFADTQLSYGELDARSQLLAGQLMAMKVTSGQFIGIYASRSIELVVAVLGVLKAGAVYCPLDMKYPLNRLSYIIADAGIDLVLTNGSSTPDFGDEVTVSHIDQLLDNQAHEFTPPALAPNAPAYLLYTSGSTGKPKGVIQCHQTICNLVANQKLNDRYVTLQFTPITFDVSMQELATAWYTGAELVLLSDDQKDDIPNLPNILIERNIERVFLPPALLNILCEVIDNQQLTLPKLKEVIVAGEALHLSGPLRTFFNNHPNCVLWNHYGPTETHVVTTYRVDVKNEKQLPPIGRIIANCHGYIVNPMGVLVPAGAVGELWISGPALAAGYCNNQLGTDEKFIQNPYARAGHERIYKTGDLVKSNQDQLVYIGRIDDQVKIRGFRIELSEIEQVLLSNDAVTECKVVKHQRQNSDVLIAYVVLKQGCSADTLATIKTSAESDLPLYMVPNQLIALAHMPLTANGKVDVKALPEPTVVDDQQTLALPVTELEAALLALWVDILALDDSHIGTNQNFFALGGHSLLLVKLCNAIKREFNIDAKLAELFNCNTVVKQAALVERKLGRDDTVARITRHSFDDHDLPMSYQQRRLWFLDQMLADKSAYNVPVVYGLQGHLDLDRLQQACERIVARHEVLQTIYVTAAGNVQAQFKPSLAVVFDIEQLPPALHCSIDAFEAQWVQSHSQQIFDLGAEAMLKVSVLTVAETRHLLLINMHHIASDGWSQQLLLKELQSFYNQPAVDLAPVAIQYADYAAWQQAELPLSADNPLLNYWLKQLDGIPAVHSLPLDFARPEVNSQKGATLFRDIPAETVAALSELSAKSQVTTFMLMQAAFALLVGRWSLQDDIVIGTPVSGRNHQQLESTVGLFVNTIALRNNLAGNPTFIDYLGATKTMVVDALEHGDYPFELLVEKLVSDRKASYNPMFQLTFSMSDDADLALALNGLSASHIAIEYKTSKVDLSLHIERRSNRDVAMWTYNSDIFSASTVAKMAATFNVLLSAIAQDPKTDIHGFDLLDGAEQDRLIHEKSVSRLIERDDRDLFARFRQTAQTHPNKVAIGFNDQVLSYTQLLNQATYLSQQLTAMDAKAGDRIGIHLPRSIELVVAMLAISRIGGCFIMLDPAYPPQRLEMMRVDANITLMISHDTVNGHWPDTVKQLTYETKPINLTKVSEPVVSVDSPAYIIFTSGSTGRPKGVEVSQKSLLNLCDWHIEQYGLDPDCCATQMTQTGFDAAVWDIWANLLAGARVQMITDDERISPTRLKQVFEQNQVSHTFVPTGLLHALSGTAVFDSPQLRYVFTGGDTLDSYVLPADSQAVLVNHYGPTEACVVTSAFVVPRDQIGRPAIGQPIDNAKVYVVNPQGKLQPDGAPGELYIGGLVVANGYTNVDVNTNASAFIPSPFAKNEQLYKTGDLVKWTTDGQLAYMGRIDHQVKIRGFRIELSEIEQALISQEAVSQAKVIVKGSGNDKQLLAFVKLIGDTTAAKDDIDEQVWLIRKNISQILPPYMRPAGVFAIDEFPLTINGKLDTAALAEYEVEQDETGGYVEPQSATEKTLQQIWQTVLAKAPISITASFFDVGGHSLLAMKLLAEVEAHFNIALSISDLFVNQTIEDMAEVIEQQFVRGDNLQLFSQQDELELQEW